MLVGWNACVTLLDARDSLQPFQHWNKTYCSFTRIILLSKPLSTTLSILRWFFGCKILDKLRETCQHCSLFIISISWVLFFYSFFCFVFIIIYFYYYYEYNIMSYYYLNSLVRGLNTTLQLTFLAGWFHYFAQLSVILLHFSLRVFFVLRVRRLNFSFFFYLCREGKTNRMQIHFQAVCSIGNGCISKSVISIQKTQSGCTFYHLLFYIRSSCVSALI